MLDNVKNTTKIAIRVYICFFGKIQWLIGYQISLIVIARQPKYHRFYALVEILWLLTFFHWHHHSLHHQQVTRFKLMAILSRLFANCPHPWISLSVFLPVLLLVILHQRYLCPFFCLIIKWDLPPCCITPGIPKSWDAPHCTGQLTNTSSSHKK